jgi:uncharacterized protein YjbI with pentapeptide repeats
MVEVFQDPNWWMRDVFTALMIGGIVASGSIVGQTMVADARTAREDAASAAQITHGIQLENLRFVRDGSSPDPTRSRPFSTLNLENQDLVGLQLANADFAYTDLANARLIASNISGGDFSRANLRQTDFRRANLRGAYFGVNRYISEGNQPGADLTGADFTGADLTNADLSHADLTDANLATATMTNVFYDAVTKWPNNFQPPPSRDTH